MSNYAVAEQSSSNYEDRRRQEFVVYVVSIVFDGSDGGGSIVDIVTRGHEDTI